MRLFIGGSGRLKYARSTLFNSASLIAQTTSGFLLDAFCSSSPLAPTPVSTKLGTRSVDSGLASGLASGLGELSLMELSAEALVSCSRMA